MPKFEVRKGDISVEGFFAEPAFNLLGTNSDVLSVVTSSLSAFCPIRGTDIRIDQDTKPIGNTNIVFELHPFNGFARISIDRAQIVFFDPHLLDPDHISSLSSSFLGAIDDMPTPNSYGHYLVQSSFHAALENILPADHARSFVSAPSEDSVSVIGNSVTYYLGQQDLRLHSSITLDMSGEFPECVFIRIAIAFDANRITFSRLKEPVMDHSKSLLTLVGLEADW